MLTRNFFFEELGVGNGRRNSIRRARAALSNWETWQRCQIMPAAHVYYHSHRLRRIKKRSVCKETKEGSRDEAEAEEGAEEGADQRRGLWRGHVMPPFIPA